MLSRTLYKLSTNELVLMDVVSLYIDFPFKESRLNDIIDFPAGINRKLTEYSSSSPIKTGS